MRNRQSAGFTLLELMIVVAVIAILAMIAIPSYIEQVRKGKRAEAVQAIGDMQLRQERWRAENPSYGTLDELTGSAASSASLNNSYKNYTISVPVNTAANYTILATRKGDLASDTRCGNFTMTVVAGLATKSESGTDTVEYCWRQ